MVVPLGGVEGLEIELSRTRSSPGSGSVSGGSVLAFSPSVRLAWLSVWKDISPTPNISTDSHPHNENRLHVLPPTMKIYIQNVVKGRRTCAGEPAPGLQLPSPFLPPVPLCGCVWTPLAADPSSALCTASSARARA